MYGSRWPVLVTAFMLHGGVNADSLSIERDIGNFQFKLGKEASRSMAQGLVRPLRAGSLYGGIDLAHSNGLYVGQWAPSVGLSSGLEVDSYMGIRREYAEAIGYEVGMIHYSYPQAETDADRNEVYGGLSYGSNSLGSAWSLNPDGQQKTLLMDVDLLNPFGANLLMRYAQHDLKSPTQVASGRKIHQFSDWSLNLSRPWQGLNIGLTYTGSSLAESECEAYNGQNPGCGNTWMINLSRSLF